LPLPHERIITSAVDIPTPLDFASISTLIESLIECKAAP